MARKVGLDRDDPQPIKYFLKKGSSLRYANKTLFQIPQFSVLCNIIARKVCNTSSNHLLKNTQQYSPPVSPIKGAWLVHSFNPSALLPSDYVDLSNRQMVSVRPRTQERKSPSYLYYCHNDRIPATPFPPTPKSALESEVTVPVHVAAGQLRFRLLDTPDPTRFAAGSDLIVKRAWKPWGISILGMRKTRKYQQLYDAVTSQTDRDSIDAFLARSRATAGDAHCTKFYPSTALGSILEPFVVSFPKKSSVTLSLLDADCFVKIRMDRLCVVQSPNSNYRSSRYSGKALCRFEPAIIQYKNAKPKTAVTIRLLEWLERPNPTDLFAQEEGRVLKKYNMELGRECPSFKSSWLFPQASYQLLLKIFPNPEVFTYNDGARSVDF